MSIRFSTPNDDGDRKRDGICPTCKKWILSECQCHPDWKSLSVWSGGLSRNLFDVPKVFGGIKFNPPTDWDNELKQLLKEGA